MHKCSYCDFKTNSIKEIEAHDAAHQVRTISDDPLVVALTLPDGCCPGRMEAARAFVMAIRELRERYPNNKFHITPFSLEGVTNKLGDTANSVTIGVSSYLAVAE